MLHLQVLVWDWEVFGDGHGCTLGIPGEFSSCLAYPGDLRSVCFGFFGRWTTGDDLWGERQCLLCGRMVLFRLGSLHPVRMYSRRVCLRADWVHIPACRLHPCQPLPDRLLPEMREDRLRVRGRSLRTGPTISGKVQSVYIMSTERKTYIWRVQIQKPLSAIWNVLLKWAILSGSYIYVQFFHFNCIEKHLYIAIRVKLLNLNIGAW